MHLCSVCLCVVNFHYGGPTGIFHNGGLGLNRLQEYQMTRSVARQQPYVDSQRKLVNKQRVGVISRLHTEGYFEEEF